MNQTLTSDLQPPNRKWVTAAGLFAIGSLSLLCVVLAVVLWRTISREQTDRLGPFEDPVVLNRVPGIDGPAAHLAEVVSYRGQRCGRRSTTIETTVFYSPGEPDGRSVPGDKVKSDIVAGCFSLTHQIAMPGDVHTGLWLLSGIVRDVHSGEVRYWSSQPFQVVP